ncbi:MAG: acetylxylan esterase, partial [Verrucomicrobia bacterium]|nr:acetylxylan esterase [Verrucomicrobiota bacterium]
MRRVRQNQSSPAHTATLSYEHPDSNFLLAGELVRFASLLLRLWPGDRSATRRLRRSLGSPKSSLIGWLFVCFVCLMCFVVNPLTLATAAEAVPAMRFDAHTPTEARAWQEAARTRLFALLMNGHQPERGPLDPKVLRTIEVPANPCVLEELTLQTLPDHRAHVWLARPTQPKGKVGAVLALHGHGGSGEQIVNGTGLYWYGRALVDRGFVVISPDIGQHELQHADWTLMGERIWDALRCIDYVITLPEVDSTRLAVAGLSLGGETTMYVAALDERLKLACSSGWLTTVANMKNGHCVCYNFPGLEQQFDFSDIFA